jgi:MFS family permease
VFGLARSGLGTVRRNPVARSVAILLLASVGFAALDNAALIFLVRRSYAAPPSAYGWILTAYSIGMVGVPFALTLVRTRSSPRRLLYAGEAVFAAGTITTGLAPGLAVGCVAQAAAGGGNGLENVGTDTLLQQHSPEAELGAVFGTVYAAPFIGQLMAYAAAPPLIDLLGPRATFVVAGSGVFAVLAYTAIRLERVTD